MLLILTLVLLAMYSDLRSERRRTFVTERRYKLYALRDKLRKRAVSHPEFGKGWLFDYLDSTIAKTIVLLPSFSVWRLAFIDVSHHEKLKELNHKLEIERSKPYNRGLESILQEFAEQINKFLFHRHWLLSKTVKAVSATSSLIRNWLIAWKHRSVSTALVAPETSTLSQVLKAS
ncbi:MAG TPA: hypothetical protein VGK22_15960 [Candidatus Angelobacter sp.]|jgi:hypothetical protein